MKIPIQNLYYLLCFAWKYAPTDLAINLGNIPASSNVLDLCAHVLVSGTGYLLRRGIDQGYLPREEHAARLRGRIHFTQTVTHRNWARPEAVCQYDELSLNVLHNQILRSTIGNLARAPEIKTEIRERLRATYRSLSGINTVQVTAAVFPRVQLHRNNRYYTFLLFVCKLVHSLHLPDPTTDCGGRFIDLLTDEKKMEKVFEEFLRNFYKQKQDEFKRVGSVHLKWNSRSLYGDAGLPELWTDVMLRSNARTIIIDAKYYKDALQENRGVRKVRSENLYQLVAYLRAEAASSHVRPEGLLIYPVGDSVVDALFEIDGFLVRIYTLNLAQGWQEVEKDLLNLTKIPEYLVA